MPRRVGGGGGMGGGGQIVIEFIQCWNGIVKLRLSHWASVINTFKLRYHPMGMSGGEWGGGGAWGGGGDVDFSYILQMNSGITAGRRP